MSDVTVRRPAECVAECSDDDHTFGPKGHGEVITGSRPYTVPDGFTGEPLSGVEWDVYHCRDHEDDPSDPSAEFVELEFWKTEFEGDADMTEGEVDDGTFLCRCCQHVLAAVVATPAPSA